MSYNNKEQLQALLLLLTENDNESSMIDLLESAHKGFTLGANDFVEQTEGKQSPSDLKSNLQVYPLAQILISIIKYYELNKTTDTVRKIVTDLLDSLENSVATGSYQSQALEITLH